MTARRGTGLAELLVAIALSGVVMAAAARGLTHHLQLQRQRDAQGRADDIVRDVHEVLRAELDHATGDVRVLGDTALHLASLRIVARPCDQNAARIVVPASELWWIAGRAGDSLAAMDTLSGVEWKVAIFAVGAQRSSAACPNGGVRLTLLNPPPPTVPVLAVPVRVWRTVRYLSYRASDGTWWFGERTCSPTCGAAQPIAGPLLPPGQGGLRFAVQSDSAGQPQWVDVAARTVVSGRASIRFSRLPVVTAP